jgi:steroid delta-isomerase-like uncharacterized protein
MLSECSSTNNSMESIPRTSDWQALTVLALAENSGSLPTAIIEIPAIDVAGRYIDAFNRHDLKALNALYAKDAVSHGPLSPGLKGRDEIMRAAEDYFKAFPDVEVKGPKTIAKADTVAVEGILTGTHKGPFRLPTGAIIPPTNKRFEHSIASFLRVNAEGLIAERRNYWDTATMLQQLGLKLGGT